MKSYAIYDEELTLSIRDIEKLIIYGLRAKFQKKNRNFDEITIAYLLHQNTKFHRIILPAIPYRDLLPIFQYHWLCSE